MAHGQPHHAVDGHPEASDGSQTPRSPAGAHGPCANTAETSSAPGAYSDDRVSRLEQKLDKVLLHVASTASASRACASRLEWDPVSAGSSRGQSTGADAPDGIGRSFGACTVASAAPGHGREPMPSGAAADQSVPTFSLQRSLTTPYKAAGLEHATSRQVHGVHFDPGLVRSMARMIATRVLREAGEQMSLERAGFVADPSDEAVEAWLEERFLGPEVHERSWSEFGAALSSWQAPFVLLHALLWEILHPQGWARTRWDICILLLLAYICVAAPFIICFGLEYTRFSALGCVELIVDIGFGLDVRPAAILQILLNFRTGFIEDNNLVISRTRIAKAYLKGWFLVDVVSVLPFQEMLTSESLGFVQLLKGARVIKLAKILRLLRIIKMLRVLKVGELVSRMETIVGKSVVRVLYLMTAAVLVTHIVACLFYYTAFLSDLTEDTWVVLSGLEDAGTYERYITALYWSFSTLCTVGYGDVTPGNAKEKVVAMIGMVIGVTVFGYFMGAMGSMLSKMGTSDAAISQYMVNLEDFLKANAVPKKLATRTTAFMRYVLHRRPLHASSELLNELSTPLKTEIVLHMHRETISCVPFLRNKDPQFVVALVTMLRLQYFAPGDVIVRQGEAGDTILFVTKGHLEVRWYYNDEEQDFSDEDIAFKAVMHKLQAPDSPRPSDAQLSATSGRWHKPAQVRPQDSYAHSERPRGVEVPTNLEMGASHGLKWNRYRLIGVQPEGSYFGEHTCLLGEKRVATVVAVTFSELNSLSRLSLERMAGQWPELIQEILMLLDGTELEYVRAAADNSKLSPLQRSGSATLEPTSSSIPLHAICASHGPVTTNLKAMTLEHMAQVRLQAEQGAPQTPLGRQSASRFLPKGVGGKPQ